MSQERWFKGRFLSRVIRYKNWAGIGSGLILGIIFITSGAGKLANPGGFLTSLGNTPLLPLTVNILIAQWLPGVELALGLLLILGISAKFMSSVSSLLVIGFIVHNSWIITHKSATEPCDCLGEVGRMLAESQRLVIMTAQNALYMDIGMLVLAIIILCAYRVDSHKGGV